MGLSFRQVIEGILGKDGKPFTYEEAYEKVSSLAVRKLCFWACVNVTANAVSVCEFRTYNGSEEVRESEYYLWNVQPNANQGAGAFVSKLIAQLFTEGEALIFEVGSGEKAQLFIADSFAKEEKGVKEIVFSKIEHGGEIIYEKLPQSKVIHISYGGENVKSLVDDIYIQYQELMTYGVGFYKRESGNKGFLELERNRQGTPEEQAVMEQQMKDSFKKFFKMDSGVMRLYRGEKYVPLQGMDARTRADTRDIRAMINDMMDFTAIAFGIPPTLMRGEVADTANAIDQLLTFCIDPLVDRIAKEINRKRFTEKEFLNGRNIWIDTTAVKHINLFDIATSFDKLIGSSGFNVDELRRRAGLRELNTKWSKAHFLTKNYELVEKFFEQSQ